MDEEIEEPTGAVTELPELEADPVELEDDEEELEETEDEVYPVSEETDEPDNGPNGGV